VSYRVGWKRFIRGYADYTVCPLFGLCLIVVFDRCGSETVAWDILTKGASGKTVLLKDLEKILYDPDYSLRTGLGHTPVYTIYQDCCEGEEKRLLQRYGLRYDITSVSPILLGEEYAKTIGHINSDSESSYAEIIEVLEGKAQFLTQKQRGEKVENVSLLVAEKGEKVLIPPDRGLVVINTSSQRLVVGSLVSQASREISEQYLRNRGAAVYVLANDRLVHNLHYPWVSEIKILKAETPPFLKRGPILVKEFFEDPGKFEVLKDPSGPVGWLTFEWLKPHTGPL
jgi:glucose-6-phosphate isomerase